MRLTRMIVGIAVCALALAHFGVAAELGTAFIYQGQLKQDGVPVTGAADFQFALWNAESGGAQLATVASNGVTLTNGLFTTEVDFGPDVFDGSARWLEIQVAFPSGGALTPLAGRQPVGPAPYALALPGLLTQQNVTSPNLIGGYNGNTVTTDVTGATIGGGGSAGLTNRVTDRGGTVGGGNDNQAGDAAGTTIDASYATVAGGYGNTASGLQSTVSGGRSNTASGSDSAVGGGYLNNALDSNSVVSGGSKSTAGGNHATVAGGYKNAALGDFSAVGGGEHNTVKGNSATVPGGVYNEAAGLFSLAAGQRAKADHTGAFVWSDSTTQSPGFFASTNKNQFLIKAMGGVGINTNAPGAALHIGGTAGADGLMFPDGTLQTTAALGGGGSLWSESGSDIYYTAGDVGIGTSSPTSMLHVIDPRSYAITGECQGEGTRGHLGHEFAGVVGEAFLAGGYGGYFLGKGYFSENVEVEGKLGIGTSSPGAKLHIGGTPGADGLMFPDGTLQTTAAVGGGGDSLWSQSGSSIFYTAGAVGIGTSSPQGKLHLAGTNANLRMYENGGSPFLAIGDHSTNVGWMQWSSPNDELDLYTYGHNYPIAIGPTSSGGVFVDTGTNGGNVGIGTESPAAKLHVGGTPGTDGIMFPDGTLQTSAAAGGGGDSLWSNFGSMIYYTAGNVGIGTAIPEDDLHVVGDTRLEGSVTIGDTSFATADLGLVASGLYGVQAETANAIGAAIYGRGSDAAGLSFGVMGSCVNDGAGVYGSGATTGVEGTSATANGVGVYGHVDASSAGTGVYGTVGSSGANYGVRGVSNSTSGFGGHFTNTSSDGTALYAESAGARTNDATLQVHNTQPVEGIAAYIRGVSNWATAHVRAEGTGEVLWLARDNPDGEYIVAYDEYYGRRVFSVDHDGWTKVSVLEITGGADLSEQFDVASDDAEVEPGMVVAIDADNPGKLVVANKPYDYTVAGVVSGAGGVKPGMLMGQKGSMADGQHPIALTGRVWTRCDASNGAIKPGDLLTTSSVPGHAMKVTDRTKAQGAMIGKAMTSLSEGKGLVLVLVSLQ
ncbi:MAG: hypothetical protein JSU63_20890 [Phycisphaerales bacterium]|nr:MAG: hypothetical protein JSU63_20890 [Phycisphaerales bacterium]